MNRDIVRAEPFADHQRIRFGNGLSCFGQNDHFAQDFTVFHHLFFKPYFVPIPRPAPGD